MSLLFVVILMLRTLLCFCVSVDVKFCGNCLTSFQKRKNYIYLVCSHWLFFFFFFSGELCYCFHCTLKLSADWNEHELESLTKQEPTAPSCRFAGRQRMDAAVSVLIKIDWNFHVDNKKMKKSTKAFSHWTARSHFTPEWLWQTSMVAKS